MDRQFTATECTLILTDETEAILEVVIAGEHASNWCSSVSLLLYEMVETLVINDPAKSIRVQVRVAKQLPYNSRGIVEWVNDSPLVAVTQVELEAWLGFFLAFVRDGVAPADHFDVELTAASGSTKSLFAVLKVDAFQSPISETELRRRIRM